MNKLAKLPAFSKKNYNRNLINKMILNFEQNKIYNMEEFSLSLKDFPRLENLELYLNNNFLTELPAFSINGNNCNIISKIKLYFE
jgi:hypothetical protein